MSARAAARLAWATLVAFLALQAVAVWLVAVGAGDADEAFSLLLVGYAVVGTLIAARQPRNLVGWLLCAIALTFAAQAVGEAYVGSTLETGRQAVGWLAGCLWYLWFGLTAIYLPLVFPDGRLVSRRWRLVVWLGSVALALSIVGAAFKPGDLDLSAPVDNPLAARGTGAELVAVAAALGDVLVAVAFLLTAASLVVRFRRARGVERQQLKWFAMVGLLMLAVVFLAIVGKLFPGGWRDVVGTVGWFSFLFLVTLGLPAATGIAILRHRLYDIDLVINRALVYGGLTAALAATYLACVLLLQLVLSPDSSLAVAGSTLAVAALVRPARGRIQASVDRRFYRRRYDAGQTLEAFAGRLRDEVDLDALAAELRGVARDTVQPAHVSLWLREREA